MDRHFGSRKEYDRQVKSVCQECFVRCGLVAYLRDGVIVDIHGDADHPVSRGRLCAKGIAFVQGVHSPDRIMSPAFRKSLQDPLEDWEIALDMCAESLRKIRDQHGSESIVIGLDPEADLDFAIGAARFAKRLGTPHVYPPYDFFKTPTAITQQFYPVSPCYEWGKSKCILFIEADMAVTHPVAFGWALDAQRQGAKIIAADARFTRTLSKADLALRILPRSGNLLGLAIMKMILEEASDKGKLKQDRLMDAENWEASFGRLSWEDLENLLGLSPKALREISNVLLESDPAVIVTGKDLSVCSSYGIWLTLGAAMGWIGKPGGGWYPLTPATLPLDPCLGVVEADADQTPAAKDTRSNGGATELDKARLRIDVSARAILCSGNILGDLAPVDTHLASDPDLIVYLGSFPNATWDRSHLVLPSTLWAEKSGVCLSTDQALQWGEKILSPGPGCRSGLDFWAGLARRFGWHDDFPWTQKDGPADSRAFYQWVLDSSPATHGCAIDRLIATEQDASLTHWPIQRKTIGGERIKPTFAPGTPELPLQTPDQDAFPLYFQKTPFISRSEEVGKWWPWTKNLEPEDAVQINPQTAGALGIQNGDEIVVTSPDRTLTGRAWITRMVPPWMVASPKNSLGERVLVQKPDRSREETLSILKELLQ